MGFLDNLENDLKALEARDQGGLDEGGRRDAERARAIAAAPWSEQLRNGAYTKTLLGAVTRAGFSRRVKVHMAWLGSVLRLEALDERLELRPGAKGVVVCFLDEGAEIRQEPLDLASDPQLLVSAWMERIDAKRKRIAEQAPVIEDLDEREE